MNLAEKVAVGIVGVLLMWTLGATVTVGTAQLTVLNAEFVTTSFEEEGGYDLLVDGFTGAVNESAGGNHSNFGIDAEETMTDAVSKEYLRPQTERNVDRLYAYLHGERDRLNLSIHLEPAKDNATRSIEHQVRNGSIAERVSTTNTTLGGPLQADTIAMMTTNVSSYREAKVQYRQRTRADIVDAMVNRTFEAATNDELLGLMIPNYDADSYQEQVKEDIVDLRSDEIKAVLRDRITANNSALIANRTQARIDAHHETYTNVTGETDLERAAGSVQAAFVRGVTTDQGYDDFRVELAASKRMLADVVSVRFRERLDDRYEDRIDVDETFSPDTRAAIGQSRDAVQLIDVIDQLLPLIAGTLIVLLYILTDSVAVVAKTLGMSMMWAGLPTFVYIRLGYARAGAEATVTKMLGDSPQASELVVGIVGRIFSVMEQLAFAVGVSGLVLALLITFINSALEDQVDELIKERVDDRLDDMADS